MKEGRLATIRCEHNGLRLRRTAVFADDGSDINSEFCKPMFDKDDQIFRVVVNHEEQYSIWPDYKDIPAGWTYAGKEGLKAECLAYIKDVWTDMRPLSLRKAMESQQSEVS